MSKNRTLKEVKEALHEMGVIRIPPRLQNNKAALLTLYSDLQQCGRAYVHIEPIFIPNIDDDGDDENTDGSIQKEQWGESTTASHLEKEKGNILLYHIAELFLLLVHGR